MPSLVAGFEYDIFISYRQKDNKYDGWVTEFVSNLRKEIEATFKEDISVYFDENPHDGLQEHHDVDESLREKLKCLVFIPIISRTYCDPESFAWKFEFSAFVDLAKQTAVGLKVKLPDGNVANRVLPVRIHELERSDTILFESVIGGVIRPIDFVYKTTGVNRPLRQNEEHSDENQNHIIYRDQINKVANAISGIISAIKDPQKFIVDQTGKRDEPQEIKGITKQRSVKILTAAIVLILFLGFTYFSFFRNSSDLSAAKSSIAVIPFRNNTGDDSKKYYGIGIASEVNTQLGLAKQFDFISSMQATVQYQQSDDSPIKIGQDLGVTHILSGMYQTAGTNIQVTAELIDAATGKAIWSLPYRSGYDDIFELQATIASKVMTRFSVSSPDGVDAPTKSPEAFYHYMKGLEITKESPTKSNILKALPELKRAIELDSGFLYPWGTIIDAYGVLYANNSGDTSTSASIVKPYIDYVNRSFPDSWQKKDIQALYAFYFDSDFDKVLDLSSQVLNENPQDVIANKFSCIVLKHKLLLAESFPYLVKWTRQEPASHWPWNNLFGIAQYNGDWETQEKAAAKIYSLNDSIPAFLYNAKRVNNSMEHLPIKIKAFYGRTYRADLLLQKRDFKSLLAFLDSVKLDLSFNIISKNYYKSIAYYLIGADKEASKHATQALRGLDENPSLSVINTGRLGIIFQMNAILGNQERTFNQLQLLDSRRKSLQDLTTQWDKKRSELIYYVYSRDFQKANILLRDLNKEFPQMGSYRWLNQPIYDRIKKEYPPFLETINQLKYTPKNLDYQLIKW